MALRYEHGRVEDIGGLAYAAGRQQYLERTRQQAAQVAAQKQQLANQLELAEFQNRLAVEAEKRAQAWELQKMELRSQNDFQIKEQIHQQRMLLEEARRQAEKQQMLVERAKYPDSDTGCQMYYNGGCLIEIVLGRDKKPIACQEYSKKGEKCERQLQEKENNGKKKQAAPNH